MSKKIEANIYYDDRCTKFPYFVNIMRCGKKLYKKTETLEECRELKEKFILDNSMQPTGHPCVFIFQGNYVLEYTVHKIYGDYDEAVRKAKILETFAEAR